MKTYKVELIDPKVKQLLEDLADLNLIKVEELISPKQELKQLLKKMRAKGEKNLTLEGITKEVETVRKKRYAKGS